MKNFERLNIAEGDTALIRFLTQADGSRWPEIKGPETGRVSSHDALCPACDLGAEGKRRMVVHLNGLRSTGKLRQVMKTRPRHKKRRNQSVLYHIRIQKKWDKRSRQDPQFRMCVAEPIFESQVKVLSVGTAVLDFLDLSFGRKHREQE